MRRGHVLGDQLQPEFESIKSPQRSQNTLVYTCRLGETMVGLDLFGGKARCSGYS